MKFFVLVCFVGAIIGIGIWTMKHKKRIEEYGKIPMEDDKIEKANKKDDSNK